MAALAHGLTHLLLVGRFVGLDHAVRHVNALHACKLLLVTALGQVAEYLVAEKRDKNKENRRKEKQNSGVCENGMYC